MKNLLLMRHASTADKTPGQLDHDRELTLFGERQAGEAGLWLKNHHLVPELVLCSTATRTQMTAQAVLSSLEQRVPIQLERAIYNNSESDLYHLLQQVEEEVDTLLVIAHNPSISALASQLTHVPISFQQGNLMWLNFPGFSWSGLRAGTCKLHLAFEG
jgi:phosphohistidine phosphatase